MSAYDSELNAMFIHVPKTAGTSMEMVMFPDTGGHDTARDFPEANGAFGFGFVRNPWDRFVSAYFCQNRTQKDKEGFNQYIDEYLYDGYPRYNVHSMHFKPMYHFLLGNDGSVGVDFVGRYESLLQDWEYVCSILNVEHELPHYRKVNHDHYKNYYTPKSWKAIGDLYLQDVEMFGYSYDKYE